MQWTQVFFHCQDIVSSSFQSILCSQLESISYCLFSQMGDFLQFCFWFYHKTWACVERSRAAGVLFLGNWTCRSLSDLGLMEHTDCSCFVFCFCFRKRGHVFLTGYTWGIWKASIADWYTACYFFSPFQAKWSSYPTHGMWPTDPTQGI